jgi:hypothetical protein
MRILHKIRSYVAPSEVALQRFPELCTLGIAYNCKRWRQAASEYGYMGIGCCNRTVKWVYWHYPCDFTYESNGIGTIGIQEDFEP